MSVNRDKTKKIMASTSSQLPIQTIQLNQNRFQVVDNFIYLGSFVNGTNIIGKKVRCTETVGNRCYYSLKNCSNQNFFLENMIAAFGSDICRRRFNHKLDILYTHIWLWRMAVNRVQLKLYEGWPEGKRRTDRSCGRWKDITFAVSKVELQLFFMCRYAT